MPDLSQKKNPMPEQAPDIRNGNFLEVSLGYPPETAQKEAGRCLNCRYKPCTSGCPVSVPIPEFIQKIKEGDFLQAYEIISSANSLPAVCGRVCPQESQCEKLCVRGKQGEPVAIGRLERFAADWHMDHSDDPIIKPQQNGHQVAVIGAGPAGLTCAGDLAKKGYEVTIFEALHEPGGVLVYGIPSFRLPKPIVKKEIDRLCALGVKILPNMVVGKTVSLDDLCDMGFEAIFIGSGAGIPGFLGIPGEGLPGVCSANEYLTRINLMKANEDGYDTPIKRRRSVAVIGGGNVAMDAARCAKRMGAEHVYIIYRRSETEMPARAEEIHHAKEEGIEFKLLTNPVQFLGDELGAVSKIECVSMELGAPDTSGRRRPQAVEGSNFIIEADAVIVAVGTAPNPLIRKSASDLQADGRGCLIVDEVMKTTKERVYAGGDATTGAATVILAMGAGKTAAVSIDQLLK